jgi:uncharacterized membrane protein
MFGYCAGGLYNPAIQVQRRTTLLLRLGTGAILFFCLLRFINVFGDPAPWSVQQNGLLTVLSFLNVTKYPVSLLFSMLTLGVILILLGILEQRRIKLSSPWIVFGRVPLFYFVLHFFIIHTVALLLFIIKTGKTWTEVDFHFDKSFGGITPEGGFSLFWVYVFWIALIVVLYPICNLYDRYKSTHNDKWLSYL